MMPPSRHAIVKDDRGHDRNRRISSRRNKTTKTLGLRDKSLVWRLVDKGKSNDDQSLVVSNKGNPARMFANKGNAEKNLLEL